MGLFSDRYWYTHPSDVIIREQITPEIQNAIQKMHEIMVKNILLFPWSILN